MPRRRSTASNCAPARRRVEVVISSDMSLHPADIAVILIYIGMVVAMGWWFSRRNKSTERYFLGGRDFPGWAIGFSFIATDDRVKSTSTVCPAATVVVLLWPA